MWGVIITFTGNSSDCFAQLVILVIVVCRSCVPQKRDFMHTNQLVLSSEPLVRGQNKAGGHVLYV